MPVFIITIDRLRSHFYFCGYACFRHGRVSIIFNCQGIAARI